MKIRLNEMQENKKDVNKVKYAIHKESQTNQKIKKREIRTGKRSKKTRDKKDWTNQNEIKS